MGILAQEDLVEEIEESEDSEEYEARWSKAKLD